MKKTYIVKLIAVFLIACSLNFASVILSRYSSPDDLAQLAFVIVVFLPAAALLTGILSQRLGISLVIAALLSGLSVVVLMLISYNSKGLAYVPIYMAAAIAGHLLSQLFSYMLMRYGRK